MSRLPLVAVAPSPLRGGLGRGALERSALPVQRTISPLSGELLFFACAKKSNQKKAHPVRRPLRGYPAMLALRGTWPNSSPHRLLEQSATSIPPEHCASRRLQGARYVHSTALRAAPLSPDPSPTRGEGNNARAMSAKPTSRGCAVAFDVGPLGRRREAQESGGMEVADCPRSLCGDEFGDVPSTPSIAGNLAKRGAGPRVCFLLVSFSLHKQRKVTRPTGRNSARTPATQSDQAIPAFIASATGSKPTAKSPLSLTLSHKGRGDGARRVGAGARHG